ncbi:NAD(P)H-dependent oxidoreductase (plasmid) [Novosphingobium sp. BL-8A]|uniref:NADPH-dependent FMN reductase n=1 Tax=Novosphingobium sp. BL-8A TaxID=3127639 RepID=UPI0037583E71
MRHDRPLVVGIGGTLAHDSSTARLLRHALSQCEEAGAEVRLFTSHALEIPFYAPGRNLENAAASELVAAMREADAVVLSSPGYHGSISGLIKNALDYTEELAGDRRPYFDGIPVGLIAAGAGWQGANATIATLRSIVHALRGWPTPLGIAVNSRQPLFDADGRLIATQVDEQLGAMTRQLMDFVARSRMPRCAPIDQ